MTTFLKLAVIGDPVAHSKSPEFHRQFLARAERNGSYEAIRVPARQAHTQLALLKDQGYVGLNVTTPLKEEVLKSTAAVDSFAEQVGAVNTLTLYGNQWNGSNTDGTGARTALEERLGEKLARWPILVLGTGPTARAAAAAFTAAGAQVSIWSRTIKHLESTAARLGIVPWTAAHKPGHIVFSALPPRPTLPPELEQYVRDARLVMDANYGPRATLHDTLLRDVEDGLAMLYAQAAASFALWEDRFPKVTIPNETLTQ